jgi:hypothetical protein
MSQDPPEPQPRNAAEGVIDVTDDTPVLTWWQRSAPRAAGAAIAIGAATAWFGSMLGRVPLDALSTLGYLLMLPLLLIVPAFSLAALRLAWAAWNNPLAQPRTAILLAVLVALGLNVLALVRFAFAIGRIFST